MAERRSGGKGSRRGKGIPHHPLVEALAPDPTQPPRRATRLFGFPGPAADAGSTRLWLDLDLTSYVDVPDEVILHSQTLENEQGTVLWVESEAQLTYSTARSEEVQADFLTGSIAEGNLSTAAAVPYPMARGFNRWPPSVGPGCLKPMTGTGRECFTWVDCETPIVRCPESFGGPCLPRTEARADCPESAWFLCP
jgi:hypothetical protein